MKMMMVMMLTIVVMMMVIVVIMMVIVVIFDQKEATSNPILTSSDSFWSKDNDVIVPKGPLAFEGGGGGEKLFGRIPFEQHLSLVGASLSPMF